MSADSKSRLCHIVKWDHFDGYGFDLHAEKGKTGQYIGKVDAGSPAHAAGLRHGDRILQVNGESIADKSHKEVVELIKAVPNETKLLVVDPTEDVPTIILPENGRNHNTSNGHVGNGTEKQAQPEVCEKTDKSEQNGAPLNLNMTAAELRARLAARKKFDPKKEAMDFKKKFDIIQKM